MPDYAEQAKVALTVYFHRSDALLKNLEKQRYDEVIELLPLQKSAFHNFRTAEYLATKYKQPLADEELKMLWQQINKILPLLDAAITDALTLLNKKVKRLAKQKNNLQNFKSKRTETTRFEKTV